MALQQSWLEGMAVGEFVHLGVPPMDDTDELFIALTAAEVGYDCLTMVS